MYNEESESYLDHSTNELIEKIENLEYDVAYKDELLLISKVFIVTFSVAIICLVAVLLKLYFSS